VLPIRDNGRDVWELLGILRSQRWLIASVTVAFALALPGVATLVGTPKDRGFRAVTRLAANPTRGAGTISLPQMAVLVNEGRLLDDLSAGSPLATLEARADDPGLTLEVAATASSAGAADAADRACVDALLGRLSAEDLRVHEAEIRAQENAVRAAERRLRDAGSPDTSSWQQARDALRQEQVTLQRLAAAPEPPPALVTLSQSPAERVPPGGLAGIGLVDQLTLGVMSGLCLGVMFAFARDALRNRIETRTDAERAFGAPVVAEITLGTEPATRSLDLGEARLLLSQLPNERQGAGCTVVAVVSADPGDGRSTTAAALATSVTHAGQRALLLSADGKSENLERLLSEIGGESTSDVLVIDATTTSAPSLHSLRATSDVVIIDTTPFFRDADTLDLAARADFVLVVCRGGRSPLRHARAMNAQLGVVGASPWAVVLTREPERRGLASRAPRERPAA
jgi:hypothetical protein